MSTLKDKLYCLRCPNEKGEKLCVNMGHDDCDLPFERQLFLSRDILWNFKDEASEDYYLENGFLFYHGPDARQTF